MIITTTLTFDNTKNCFLFIKSLQFFFSISPFVKKLFYTRQDSNFLKNETFFVLLVLSIHITMLFFHNNETLEKETKHFFDTHLFRHILGFKKVTFLCLSFFN